MWIESKVGSFFLLCGHVIWKLNEGGGVQEEKLKMKYFSQGVHPQYFPGEEAQKKTFSPVSSGACP